MQPTKRQADPTTRGSEATREALLNAGAELFAERGLDGATVDRIARRARVNKALINYHFGGKDRLYEAILEATFAAASERLSALRESDEPADVRLARFIEIYVERATERPALPAMLLREVLSGGQHINEKIAPYFLAIFTVVREIIEQGVREGTFRPVDPLLTHLGLIGSIVFFFSTARFRERLITEGRLPVKLPDPADYVRHVQEMAHRGLAADGPWRARAGRRP